MARILSVSADVQMVAKGGCGIGGLYQPAPRNRGSEGLSFIDPDPLALPASGSAHSGSST